ELAADDPAAQDDEALRHLGLREQTRRVDAEIGLEPGDRRAERERARCDDRALEGDVLAALDRDRVRVLEGALALHPLDTVCLEQARDAAGHLLDDAGLPLVRGSEVERGVVDLDAELGEGLVRLVQEVRGLHPGLGRDAADAEARAAEVGLLLDACDLRAELRRTDRRRVSARAAAQDCDVEFHDGDGIDAGYAADAVMNQTDESRNTPSPVSYGASASRSIPSSFGRIASPCSPAKRRASAAGPSARFISIASSTSRPMENGVS